MSENKDLWRQQGGNGPRTALLLHGLGATGAVWTGLQPLLEQRGMRWIAPDFAGHGLSPWSATYSIGQLAAGVAQAAEGYRLSQDPGTSAIAGLLEQLMHATRLP